MACEVSALWDSCGPRLRFRSLSQALQGIYTLCPVLTLELTGVWGPGFHGASVSLCLSCPGVIGVCLGGYLIEATGSWTCIFNLVAVISNLGLGIFLVFGKAQRVDLAPAHEDL